MTVFISILTGAAAIGNFALWNNGKLPVNMIITAQTVLLIITFIATCAYKGPRTYRPPYLMYSLFTFRFSVIILSLVGNASVLAGILLN